MNPGDPSVPPPPGPAVRFALLALLLVLALLPPETRGESAAGSAALIAILAVVAGGRSSYRAAEASLAVALACAWPAVAFAQAPGAAVEPIAVALLAGVVGVVAVSHGQLLRERSLVPTVVAVAATAVSVQAIAQWIHGLDAIAQALERTAAWPDRDLVLVRLREGRAFGAFATPAALGGFLAITIPITFGAAGVWGARRLVAAACIGVQCMALACSASASAIGALFAATVVFLFRARGSRPLGRLLATLVVVGVLLVLGIALLRGRPILDPGDPESPWRQRAGNVRVAAAIFGDHPWRGVGVGGFGEAYPRYRRAGENEAQHAHDLPAELLAENGLLVGVVLTALFFWVFAAPVLRRREGAAGWQLGATVGLAAFAFQNLLDFTASFPSMLWTAAILRGCLAPKTAPTHTPVENRLSALVLSARTLAAIVAGSVVALAGLAWNARGAAREAVVQERWEEADTLSRRAVRLSPWDVDARLLRAQVVLEREGAGGDALAEALAEAEAAVRLSPVRPFARALRARLRLALGDVPGAYADLCEASRLYPLHADYAHQCETFRTHLPDPR